MVAFPNTDNMLMSRVKLVLRQGKRIMGATCSTNFAAEYNLKSKIQPSGKWTYACDCRGTADTFSPKRGEAKNCYLHYWQCPLTT